MAQDSMACSCKQNPWYYARVCHQPFKSYAWVRRSYDEMVEGTCDRCGDTLKADGTVEKVVVANTVDFVNGKV